jgi:hypothetical protein
MTKPTWITDRRPTKSDGDNDGDVIMQRRAGQEYGTWIHWSHVGAGIPWHHCSSWKPPVTLPGINGQWIDGASVLPTQDHADVDGEVQVHDAEGWTGTRSWDMVGKGNVWRPYPSKDSRPLVRARAEGTLPGLKGEWISGSDALPTREHGDDDGEVMVMASKSSTSPWARGWSSYGYEKWQRVIRTDAWQPFSHKDNRPQR